MNHVKDPFRYLFPFGCFAGIVGVFYWIFFYFKIVSMHPVSSHSRIMFFVFLWSYVAGFLMTAIPRMTGTNYASKFEVATAFLLASFAMVGAIVADFEKSILVLFLQNLFLIFFIARRFKSKKKPPFSGFFFIPLAFFQVFLGGIIYLANKKFGHLWLFIGEAFVINLIIGIGSRLIPVLCRLPNALVPTESDNHKSDFRFLTLAFLLNLSYWIQAFWSLEIGVLIRVIAVLFASIILMGLLKKPTTWSALGVALKAGILCLILGTVLTLPSFEFGVAGKHFLYIAVFSLITIMISTRVVLAHSEQNLEYEINSRRIISIFVLILVSAILRVYVANDVFSPMILVASILFILAMLLWVHKFFVVTSQFLKKPQSKSN